MATATGTTRTVPPRRIVPGTAPMRLPRSTGALSGALVVLLGIWGGLIPFFGPYFHYAFGGFQTWHYTTQRLWLDIVPGAVAVIGGLMLLTAATRTGGLTAGWVALAAGIWFVIGPSVSLLWHDTTYPIGAPAGGHIRQMLEWIGYFYGLGAVIIGFTAFAMGRYFSRPRVAEEPAVVAATGAGTAAARPVATSAAGAPVATETAAARPVANETAADRPVATGTAADRPVATGTAADRPVATGTAADRPVAAEAAAPPRRRFGLFRRRRRNPDVVA